MDQTRAIGRVHVLRCHRDGSSGKGLLRCRVARVKVVPGIVADVVRALRLVDAQEIDLAVLVLQRDADVVAVD